MKIIIAGGGKVGSTLAKELCEEDHDLVLIDKDARVLEDATETLDVAVIHGNGASVEILTEAGVKQSDLMIAATSSDELNILCCLVARKLGAKNTIARVRNPEYDNQMGLLKEELGLSLSINPEKACAREIFRVLQFPSFLKRDSFAKGLVELVELRLKDGNVLIGNKLMDIGKLWLRNINICAVDRGGKVFIPSGSFELLEDDIITIASSATELATLLKTLRVPTREISSVIIIGGGRIAEYLANLLIKAKVQVTIIENDRDRCDQLTEALPGATVINGDGTDQALLRAEGIEHTDALITLTGMDEENLIISMFGNFVGVPKTVTKITRTEYAAVFADKGIDTIVNPKVNTTAEIISYVSAMQSAGGGSIVALYYIADEKAQAIEFFIDYDADFLGIPLKDLSLKENIVIVSIIRRRKVIIPKGADVLERGDSVVVVAATEREILHLHDIFSV